MAHDPLNSPMESAWRYCRVLGWLVLAVYIAFWGVEDGFIRRDLNLGRRLGSKHLYGGWAVVGGLAAIALASYAVWRAKLVLTQED